MPSDLEILALPACRRMAEEMSIELDAMMGAPLELESATGALDVLLSDLSRPASRDAWVRWLIAHDTRERWGQDMAADDYWGQWRDDPAALKAAILEVGHE